MAPVHLAKSLNVRDFFLKRTGLSQPSPPLRGRKSISCDQNIQACDSPVAVGIFTPSAVETNAISDTANSAASDLVRWASSSLVTTLRGLKFSTATLQHLSNVWPNTGGGPLADVATLPQSSVSDQVSNAAPLVSPTAKATPAPPTAEQLAQYVQPVSKLAIKRARVYADLADLAYDVARLSVAFLFSRHKLKLVKTSKQDADSVPPAAVSNVISSLAANNIVPFGADYGEVEQVRDASRYTSAQLKQPVTEPVKQTSSSAKGSAARQTPLEWFACDNPDNGTRIFAIQGSVSLQHWAINLSFDPVTFGDESLGVKVHRGVYETALTLYDQLLPLVVDHLKTSPKARVTFTGHSLGGSVASVLMLLYVFHGVLHPNQVSPVYTFGAPAVFCEAPVMPAPTPLSPRNSHNTGLGNIPFSPSQLFRLSSPPGPDATPLTPTPLTPTQILQGAATSKCSLTTSSKCCRSLLRVIGVPEDSICNVIMHHDIVPRAFVCDYSSVSEFLRSWGPSFRHHVGLSPVNQHKVMYDFIGVVCVLQPDRRQEFVFGDEYHSLLPPFPHLYSFTLPDGMLEDACISLRQAVLTFMNNPHPLTILTDYQSYGERGLISRYHNPQHYAKALFGLLRKSL